MRVFSMSRWLGGAVLGLVATVAIASPASASGYKMTQAQATSVLRANGVTWSSSGNCSNR